MLEVFLGAWICCNVGCGRVLHVERESDRAHVSLEGRGPERRCGNGEPLAGERFVESHVVLVELKKKSVLDQAHKAGSLGKTCDSQETIACHYCHYDPQSLCVLWCLMFRLFYGRFLPLC